MVTVSGVSNRSVFVHLRVTATERKRWQEAAASSGRSLSQMIRDGIEGKLAGRDHREGDGVSRHRQRLRRSPRAQRRRRRSRSAWPASPSSSTAWAPSPSPGSRTGGAQLGCRESQSLLPRASTGRTPELRATPQESARPRCPIGRTEAAHPRALSERSVRGRQVTAGGLADDGSSAPVLRQWTPDSSGL